MKMLFWNVLTQDTQDEAYTLAFYLLGDEPLAWQAAWETLQKSRWVPASRPDAVRLEIFHNVLAYCWGRTPAPLQEIREPLVRQITCLRADQRAAVILVDVLNVSYAEAGKVMRCTTGSVARLVAQARVAMNRARKAERI